MKESLLAEKKILVTGGLGYVGSSFVKKLDKLGVDYLAVDKRKGSDNTSVQLDLKDKDQVKAMIDEFSPDLIFHFGTHSAMAYRENLMSSFKDDFISISNIFESVKKKKCRIVFFSSTYVYSGWLGDDPVIENEILRPIHNFGVAKLFFEQLIQREFPGFIIYRLSSVFGPGEALNPNSVYNMIKEYKDSGKITIWGSGRRKMQYVYIDDVIEILLNSSLFPSDIYNLGGEDYTSTSESATAISSLLKAKISFLKDRSEGETLPMMSVSKIKKYLPGFQFKNFHSSLKQYISSMKGW